MLYVVFQRVRERTAKRIPEAKAQAGDD